MKLYLKKRNSDVTAIGEYNFSTGEMLVKKGAIVSEKVTTEGKFKSVKTVMKNRELYCNGRKTKKDVVFRSASSAANFVTGISTNGLIAWKDKDGKPLKTFIEEQ